jgi:hypothetical protein
VFAVAAACSSDNGPNSTNATTTSVATPSTTPEQRPNEIPFDVGARVGLYNGWTVTVAKVRRPFTNGRLAETPDGRQYVALDITVENRGTTTATLDAAEVFSLGDSTGQVDEVVPVPGRSNGLDGDYPPQRLRSGRLVFDVPVGADLRMAFDGTPLGSQHAIFMVDPPNVPPAD